MSDELRAMQLHLHPTRREALTATEKAITRWSLETNPATILAQMSTVPESLFDFSYSASAQVLSTGGITGSPDGLLFAHEQLKPDRDRWSDPPTIEWRNWDDLAVARAVAVPLASYQLFSLACSPDGRWLVLESVGYRPDQEGVRRNTAMVFLLDWRTGRRSSRHDIKASVASGLTFDTTSTFVAGVLQDYDGGNFLGLWRLDPVERFRPRPIEQYWSTGETFSPDEVSGPTAMSTLDLSIEPGATDWTDPYFSDAPDSVQFSPDSRIVIFSLNASLTSDDSANCFKLEAYEVASGKRLWFTRSAVEATGPAIFRPDSSVLLIPELSGELLVYRVEDGALVQRLPTGLSEPIQALAFDHDGKTLWLATEEGLVQHQPKR